METKHRVRTFFRWLDVASRCILLLVTHIRLFDQGWLSLRLYHWELALYGQQYLEADFLFHRYGTSTPQNIGLPLEGADYAVLGLILASSFASILVAFRNRAPHFHSIVGFLLVSVVLLFSESLPGPLHELRQTVGLLVAAYFAAHIVPKSAWAADSLDR